MSNTSYHILIHRKILVFLICLSGALSFAAESDLIKTPNGEFIQQNSSYGKLISTSKAIGYADPFDHVLYTKDKEALKLLVEKGHNLNPKTNRPLDRAIYFYVMARESERAERWAMVELLIDLGANKNYEKPKSVEDAMRSDLPELVVFMLQNESHPKGSLSRILFIDVVISKFLENNPVATNALIVANRSVPEGLVRLAALGNNPKVLRSILASGLPVGSDMLHWVNGNQQAVSPDIQILLNKHTNDKLRMYVDRVGKVEPGLGDNVTLMSYYINNKIKLILKSSGNYSGQLVTDFMGYSTNICLNRIGDLCGSVKSETGQNWLNNIKISCDVDTKKFFDEPMCKLAGMYVADKPLKLYIFFSPSDSPESYSPSIEAFCQIGQKSIHNGATPLTTLQTECRPIY